MTAEQRAALIRQRLHEAFAPEALEVIDDSDRHRGHAGARGGGHFTVRIVAAAFAGKSPLERHRMVYGALREALAAEIHALGIEARSPDET